MDKRYQVFVSSTYVDLKKERQNVIQTLMEMDCIPAGMELFPAADEEQWEFIKKVIDDCDYYLLILGGRYGSVAPDGKSYTEKEFDYAVSKGIKVIALIHEAPDELPTKFSEKDPEKQRKLSEFKNKVSSGRVIKFWKEPKDLSGAVSLSLTKTIKMYPAVGWVRANKIANEETLFDLTKLQKEKNVLLQQISDLQKKITPSNEKEISFSGKLVSIKDSYTLHGSFACQNDYNWGEWETSISWKKIFKKLSPYLVTNPSERELRSVCIEVFPEEENSNYHTFRIDDDCFETILAQLTAYRLITSKYSYLNEEVPPKTCSLTSAGKKFMLESRLVKKVS